DLYSNFLTTLLPILEQAGPKVIIDVGCGNGIISCFCARKFPDARVIGVDISENAIACAQDLSKNMGFTNAEFIVCGIDNISLPIESGTADVIMSIASLGPLSEEVRMTANTPITKLLNRVQELSGRPIVPQIVSYLTPETGQFISFDKVSSIETQLLWSANIQKAGARLDTASSGWITYNTIDQDPITLPLLIARKFGEPTRGEEIVSFFLSKDIEQRSWQLDYGQEALAEIVFSYTNPKSFERGGKAVYNDGTGTIWYEVWQAGPFVLTFEHSDQGFRSLKVQPSLDVEEAMSAFDEWLEQTKKYATVTEMDKPEIEFSP
ncbi:MAG: class I SAM-dependent methyltransferase, partial [Cyanobacteria bacterium]|nr:class I SAM-dependent methyltransferase [Cyanobacteriota bacterium]